METMVLGLLGRYAPNHVVAAWDHESGTVPIQPLRSVAWIVLRWESRRKASLVRRGKFVQVSVAFVTPYNWNRSLVLWSVADLIQCTSQLSVLNYLGRGKKSIIGRESAKVESKWKSFFRISAICSFPQVCSQLLFVTSWMGHTLKNWIVCNARQSWRSFV